tara:strand:+ start:442 stop:660 length:219 start_codon:yes stop_codon:yes gene_type:complete
MENTYNENIENTTKKTCKIIKDEINTLENVIDILQKKRNELIRNKKINDPPAGIQYTIANNSMIHWQNSLRN